MDSHFSARIQACFRVVIVTTIAEGVLSADGILGTVHLYIILIELCAGGDVGVDHQQMQLFFTVFVVHGGD